MSASSLHRPAFAHLPYYPRYLYSAVNHVKIWFVDGFYRAKLLRMLPNKFECSAITVSKIFYQYFFVPDVILNIIYSPSSYFLTKFHLRRKFRDDFTNYYFPFFRIIQRNWWRLKLKDEKTFVYGRIEADWIIAVDPFCNGYSVAIRRLEGMGTG